jgi:hypothetical protein
LITAILLLYHELLGIFTCSSIQHIVIWCDVGRISLYIGTNKHESDMLSDAGLIVHDLIEVCAKQVHVPCQEVAPSNTAMSTQTYY